MNYFMEASTDQAYRDKMKRILINQGIRLILNDIK